MNSPPNDFNLALIAVVESTAHLFDAIDQLLHAQGLRDPTWMPVVHAKQFADTFCHFHPAMTVVTLIDGFDLCTAALLERVDWELNR